MSSIEECRLKLKKANKELSNEQVEQIIKLFYQLALIELETFKNKKNYAKRDNLYKNLN